jgi:hypothetical protein
MGKTMKHRPATDRVFLSVAAYVSCWAVLFAAQVDRPPAAGKESEHASPEQIQRWIGELTHDSYPVRKEAGERLLGAGRAAREKLLAAAESPDPELRAAAQRIASLIEMTEFRRRLDAFAADVDGRQGHSLPGWHDFQRLVGKDGRSRALFVEMQRQEAALLASAFGERPANLPAAWENRLGRMSQVQMLGGRSAMPSLASCATMIFLGCGAEMEVSDASVEALAQMIQRTPMAEAMLDGTHRAAVRRLVSAWIVHCPNKSSASLSRRLNLAGIFQLQDALPLALGVAISPGPSRSRAEALLVVARLGTREHVEQLEPLLEDATVCYAAALVGRLPGATPGMDVQIRDVALVALLQLTGQRPADYGYAAGIGRGRPVEIDVNPAMLAPRSAERRGEAIAKWRKWRAADRESRGGEAERPSDKK